MTSVFVDDNVTMCVDDESPASVCVDDKTPATHSLDKTPARHCQDNEREQRHRKRQWTEKEGTTGEDRGGTLSMHCIAHTLHCSHIA